MTSTSTSAFVCARAKCGLPVTMTRGAWRHALGRHTGAIPPSMRHKPVPVERADYERAFALGTPAEEARELLDRFRRYDLAVNPPRTSGSGSGT